jgi:hypothetical protein
MIPENQARRFERLFAHPESVEPAGEEAMKPVVSKETLEQICKLFEQYAAEVDRCDLSQSSKTMYLDHANCFVRWIYGGFKPGVRGSNSRSRRTSQSL